MATPPKLLRYPLDVIDSTTDYMFIEVLKYEPGGVPSFAGAGSASQATSQAADSLANQLELDGANLDYLLLLVLV
jgi:hypothetical protein